MDLGTVMCKQHTPSATMSRAIDDTAPAWMHQNELNRSPAAGVVKETRTNRSEHQMNVFSVAAQTRDNNSRNRLAGIAGVCAGTGMIAYGLIPRILGTWGATDTEKTTQLPGDEFIPAPDSQQTMAVSIAARPDQVWPWLVQMGVDRAGLYSYTWVENGLLRLGVVNADRVHPEWQDLKVGDIVAFTPANYPGGRQGPQVVALEKNQFLILDASPGAEPGRITGTWQFVLRNHGDSNTRLLLRSRSGPGRPLPVRLIDLLLQPGYLIMDRAMLRGIKERAERSVPSPVTDASLPDTQVSQFVAESGVFMTADSGEAASV
jgi:hypothetical protein